MCDTIQEKCEKAVAKKHSGYNCAQAVACTFCEEAGLDDETMRNLMQGFGNDGRKLRCNRRSGGGSRNDQ